MLATLLLSAAAAATPTPFDAAQLSGSWSDSVNTSSVCEEARHFTRMQLSDDHQRLAIFSDRTWKSKLGETNRFAATVVAETEHSLILRYDNETRFNAAGKLVEWQMIIVAPGMYRWRETGWPEGKVNGVVGIRCSP
ncbi:hypothetical protein [Janthinobacterium sp. RB2P8]|uniref:hypothetical protein n=1 Tax=Janthinobacterium sp. RB2P8 TaxID=3424191 RepID=UPI003F261F52